MFFWNSVRGRHAYSCGVPFIRFSCCLHQRWVSRDLFFFYVQSPRLPSCWVRIRYGPSPHLLVVERKVKSLQRPSVVLSYFQKTHDDCPRLGHTSWREGGTKLLVQGGVQEGLQLAVWDAIQVFQDLEGQHFLILLDNITTVASLNKQGALKI